VDGRALALGAIGTLALGVACRPAGSATCVDPRFPMRARWTPTRTTSTGLFELLLPWDWFRRTRWTIPDRGRASTAGLVMSTKLNRILGIRRMYPNADPLKRTDGFVHLDGRRIPVRVEVVWGTSEDRRGPISSQVLIHRVVDEPIHDVFRMGDHPGCEP
jgi:hypothetical protein